MNSVPASSSTTVTESSGHPVLERLVTTDVRRARSTSVSKSGPLSAPASGSNGQVNFAGPNDSPTVRHREPLLYAGPNMPSLTPPHDSHASYKHVRSRSFSETGQEAIRQLAPPVSVPLVVLCLAWYATSAMSNTLNKSILTAFPYPVTLSMVQFVMAVTFGASTLLAAGKSPAIAHSLPAGVISATHPGIRMPTRHILMATAPMGMFQLSGHILSHMSTSMIPVSLVHTIKALSPLFTVAAYRLLFGVKYATSTYLSLIPLTVGVIMTCSVELDAHFMGIIYALLAALIFVSQNMFSKKLLTSGSTDAEQDDAPKLDKLNILCYCSSLAFLFTFPLWFLSEGFTLLSDFSHSHGYFAPTTPSSGLLAALLANGFVHFAQNLLAFQVLGMVTPVTYSVASLIKRIVVITVAILWFGQNVTGTQQWGILLTFLGLYLYDRCGADRTKRLSRPVLPK